MSLEGVQEVNSAITSEPTKEEKSILSPQSRYSASPTEREVLNTERVHKTEGKPTRMKYNCILAYKGTPAAPSMSTDSNHNGTHQHPSQHMW